MLVIVSAVLAVVIVIGGTVLFVTSSGLFASAPAPLTAEQLDALPLVRGDEVVPGLLAYDSTTIPASATVASIVTTDTAVYGEGHRHPVGRLAAKNEFGNPSVVIVVRTEGDWSLVLTPARAGVPAPGKPAPAQSAGWVRSSVLAPGQNLPSHVEISRSDSTMKIVNSSGATTATFPVVLSSASVPLGTGFIRLRYTDATIGQTRQPVTVTTLYATDAEAPYGPVDRGGVAFHGEKSDSGAAVIDGAIRVPEPAMAALTALPLGTLVTIR